jgi:diadenosine tetraphosphate (Ap4A) HIT family hydrolase
MPEIDIKLIEAVIFGEEYIRDGHIVVNPIGEATYIDFKRVTKEELEELVKLKERIREVL